MISDGAEADTEGLSRTVSSDSLEDLAASQYPPLSSLNLSSHGGSLHPMQPTTASLDSIMTARAKLKKTKNDSLEDTKAGGGGGAASSASSTATSSSIGSPSHSNNSGKISYVLHSFFGEYVVYAFILPNLVNR